MAFRISNFIDNDDVQVVEQLGGFRVTEWKRDVSVDATSAMTAYFASLMNVRRRQLVCDLSQAPVTVQAGTMQWMAGDVRMTSGIKGAGDFLSKSFRSMVTNESVIKPEYTGTGVLVLEPTYRHILLIDVRDWGSNIVLEDGMFLACDARMKHQAVRRKTLSSVVAGGEGIYNLAIQGDGILALESTCPRQELIEVTLQNDTLKIDGNQAIAWSASLEFTVERSGKTMLGSAASGEGLVNVYRGTGKVLLAPVNNDGFYSPFEAE